MKPLQRVFRRTLLIMATVLLLFGVGLGKSVWAMESQTGEYIAIAQDEVVEDDLYVAGSTVRIDGTVRGDVIGAGREIIINGLVEGDLIAAGQAIVINGTVTDDVRMAGQVLQIGSVARIGDDVVAAGASLETQSGSEIAGDLSFAGAQALIAGAVQEEFQGAMAALELRGTVGENVDVAVAGAEDEAELGERPVMVIEPPFTPPSPVPVPEVPLAFTVTDSAQIGGNLIYQSNSEAMIDPAAQIAGETEREPIEATEVEPVGAASVVWDIVQRWITLLLIGSLLLWLVPSWIQRLSSTVQAKPLPSLGWGIVTLLIVGLGAIAIPIVTIVLAVILGSFLWNLAPLILGVGFLGNLTLIIGFLLFIGYIPAIALSYWGGQRLLQTTQPNWATRRIAALAIGLLIFVLLTAIPILGGLIQLLVILLGLGALWFWVLASRATPADPTPVA